MRRLFIIILSMLVLSSGMALGMPASDEKDGQKTEQNTKKKDEKKKEKKEEEKKEDDKNVGKPHQPINLVYEFAWPWIMR